MNDLTAGNVMTAQVMKAETSWSIQHLAEFLVEHSISGAPVVDDNGTLVGVVSLTDIVRHDAIPVEGDRRSSFFHDADGTFYSARDLEGFRVVKEERVRVADIMTPAVFRVDQKRPVTEVADDMVRGRIHRVLVTEGNEVVGIISALDILRAVRDDISV